jgi:membrane fusion protein, multidrug efflux system
MRAKAWAVGVGAGVLVVGFLVGWALTRNKGPNPGDAAAKTVLSFTDHEVVRPQPMALQRRITFTGPLVAPSTAIVRAKAAGTLIELAVREGSRVHAGQALGRIDLAELNARLAEKQAQLEAARSQWAQADHTQRANVQLAQQKFISPNALETSRAALENAKAQFDAAQAQVETAKIQLRDAALVAPIDGIVAKRSVVPGEKVAAEQELITIVDLRELEMAGMVGTQDVAALQPGMAVDVQVEGFTDHLNGVLARIAPVAESGTRSIGVTVALKNPTERLRAGQFATALVRLPGQEAVPTVPLTAITSSSGQDYVWTLEGGKLLHRVVTTGRSDAELGVVEILDGLPPGVHVLAARFDNLKEGGLAKVTPSSGVGDAVTHQAAAAASMPASSAASAVPTAVRPL